jgi:ParB family chromosome partitioning protein
MTFFNFEFVLISDIKVGTRLRKEYGDINSLAKSIETLGLLQPIIITKDKWLVAGERRLRAVMSLGWTKIPAVILSTEYSGVVA